jgi:hypothetical protein
MGAGQPKRLIDPTEAFEDEPTAPDLAADDESGAGTGGSDPWASLRKPGAPARPAPDSDLTADQLRIRELEDRLAKSEGQKDPEPQLVAADPGSDQNILIHFLEDGFTALGQVWMRGQELEFTPGSPAYNDTIDREGKSWLDYRDREFDQVDKWGKIMFRKGPWPGKSFKDATFVALKSLSGAGTVPVPTEDELTAAEQRERSRRRAAPTFPKA